MSYTKKAFDRELHKENDLRARNAVLEYMRSTGSFVMPNDDIYGPDLVLYGGLPSKQIAYLEVEIKYAWPHGSFPYDTIQLPHRKEKFLLLGLPIEFWVLSVDLQQAIIIPDYILAKAPVREVRNRYVDSGEMFYQVPVDQCIHRSLSYE